MRAQLELLIFYGVRPSYVDSHMGLLYTRKDLFDVYLRVARDYRIPACLSSDLKRAAVIGDLFFISLWKSSAWLTSDNAPGALTPPGPDVIVEVFFFVVESDFFAGFDTLLRPNPHPVAGDECFRIGPTRVVNVAGGVGAGRAINHPLGINSKEVLPAFPFRYFNV